MKKLVLLLASYLVIIGASLLMLEDQQKASEEQATTAFILGAQYTILSCVRDRYIVIPPTIKQKAKGANPVLVRCDSIMLTPLVPRKNGNSEKPKPKENPGIDIKM